MGWDLEVLVRASRPSFQKGWKVVVEEVDGDAAGAEYAAFGMKLGEVKREAISQYLIALASDISAKVLEDRVDSIRFFYKVDKPRKKRDASRVRGKRKK